MLLMGWSFKTLNNLAIMANQLIRNETIRNYATEQALLGFKYLFFNAKKLIPSLKMEDIVSSRKVGIRPQLYNNISRKLLTDFYLETTPGSP